MASSLRCQRALILREPPVPASFYPWLPFRFEAAGYTLSCDAGGGEQVDRRSIDDSTERGTVWGKTRRSKVQVLAKIRRLRALLSWKVYLLPLSLSLCLSLGFSFCVCVCVCVSVDPSGLHLESGGGGCSWHTREQPPGFFVGLRFCTMLLLCGRRSLRNVFRRPFPRFRDARS